MGVAGRIDVDRPNVTILKGDARDLDLPDDSVDLIVTSPPYFGLRSYQDGGEHYAEQIGAEATPAEFVDALIDCTREWMRVVKPSGSIWVNLGDKYVADNRGSAADAKRGEAKHAPAGPAGYVGQGIMPRKSLMGIPWRYAIRCIDELGLILRAEVIWSKPNGLPESVTDRVRRSHEQWFHFTLEPRYYSAVDEIREEHAASSLARFKQPFGAAHDAGSGPRWTTENVEPNPLGKLPGSVWTIATEPLHVPDHLGVDHFAAFPTEWPRRIIQGWSPRGVCVECGAGRRPVRGVLDGETEMRRVLTPAQYSEWTTEFGAWVASSGISPRRLDEAAGTAGMGTHWTTQGDQPRVPSPHHWARLREAFPAIPEWFDEYVYSLTEVPKRQRKPRDIGGGKDQYSFDSRHNPAALGITGEACDCPEPTAPTTPGVVLDPFGGTGTTALVASVLGRRGISNDMSSDYNRIAEWRTTDPKQRAKAARKPYTPAAEQVSGQLGLFDQEDIA